MSTRNDFDIFICDNDKRIVTESLQAKFSLYPEYFEMIEEFYADQKPEDDAMPSENNYYQNICISKRSQITTIEKHWYWKTMIWGVKISVKGAAYDCEPTFKTEEETQEFFDAIKQWVFHP